MRLKPFAAGALAAVIALGPVISAAPVFADGTTGSSSAGTSSTNDVYVSLGADLTADQRSTVLNLLGVTESELSNDHVITITNQEEHDAYDDYLPQSVIGSKALSSSKVTQKEDGNGIQVTTQNITYVTTQMYQNALATAGMKNADVVVAGPFNISGTAALLGVTKAYSEMTGTSLKADAVDAAADELVVTSDLGDSTGDTDKAAELIASVKEGVASSDGKMSDDEIEDLIDDAAKQIGITLTDDQKDQILKLMDKIAGLDLDSDQLTKQAGNIYDKLAEKGIDLHVSKTEALNWFQKILKWFQDVWHQIRGN